MNYKEGCIIYVCFTSGFTIDCTCILKEHFKKYSIWNIIEFNKKSFKILMVKQSKNKNTADIFSAIWRFSWSMQMYRIGVYNTTARLISHNISNPSKIFIYNSSFYKLVNYIKSGFWNLLKFLVWWVCTPLEAESPTFGLPKLTQYSWVSLSLSSFSLSPHLSLILTHAQHS